MLLRLHYAAPMLAAKESLMAHVLLCVLLAAAPLLRLCCAAAMLAVEDSHI
jgi:hypothetical protein